MFLLNEIAYLFSAFQAGFFGIPMKSVGLYYEGVINEKINNL